MQAQHTAGSGSRPHRLRRGHVAYRALRALALTAAGRSSELAVVSWAENRGSIGRGCATRRLLPCSHSHCRLPMHDVPVGRPADDASVDFFWEQLRASAARWRAARWPTRWPERADVHNGVTVRGGGGPRSVPAGRTLLCGQQGQPPAAWRFAERHRLPP